jgi:hypothetical protein
VTAYVPIGGRPEAAAGSSVVQNSSEPPASMQYVTYLRVTWVQYDAGRRGGVVAGWGGGGASCNRTADNVKRGSGRQQEAAAVRRCSFRHDHGYGRHNAVTLRTHAPVRDMNHFVQDSAPHSWGQIAACVRHRPQQARQRPASESRGRGAGFKKGTVHNMREGGVPTCSKRRGSHAALEDAVLPTP